MRLEKNILRSDLTVEGYPYQSIIDLVIDRLRTDSDKDCMVGINILLEVIIIYQRFKKNQ